MLIIISSTVRKLTEKVYSIVKEGKRKEVVVEEEEERSFSLSRFGLWNEASI